MARSDRKDRDNKDASNEAATTARRTPERPCPSRFYNRAPQIEAPLQAARHLRQHTGCTFR